MVRIWKYNHQMTAWLACHMKQWWSTITLWLLIKTLHFYSSSLQIFKCNKFNKIFFFFNLNHDFLPKKTPYISLLYIYCWHKINYARVDLFTKINTRKHLATTFFNPEGTLEVHKNHTSKFHTFGAIALCLFSYLNFVRSIPVLLKLCKASTWNFISR